MLMETGGCYCCSTENSFIPRDSLRDCLLKIPFGLPSEEAFRLFEGKIQERSLMMRSGQVEMQYGVQVEGGAQFRC